ncbi:MAG: hypothetical protein LBN25_01155 [Christensenellaceae bacterium]|nr:hypothetical protein [Christensenellaceae bacterium]
MLAVVFSALLFACKKETDERTDKQKAADIFISYGELSKGTLDVAGNGVGNFSAMEITPNVALKIVKDGELERVTGTAEITYLWDINNENEVAKFSEYNTAATAFAALVNAVEIVEDAEKGGYKLAAGEHVIDDTELIMPLAYILLRDYAEFIEPESHDISITITEFSVKDSGSKAEACLIFGVDVANAETQQPFVTMTAQLNLMFTKQS